MKPSHQPPAIRSDCAHYRGELPCVKDKVCWECDEFEAIGKRALVIKFGAPGDALRTTPLLARLRHEGYREITWISDSASLEVLSAAENIDRLIPFGPEAITIVLSEQFATVFSLDKAPAARALAMMAMSPDKRGFSQTADGRLTSFDERGNYALRLGIDDDLKFHQNKKTVPQMIYEMCGYDYAREPYEFKCSSPAIREKGMIAFNIGVGPKWPSKAWTAESWVSLAVLAKKRGLRPIFVGGEAERKMLEDYATRAHVEFRPPASLGEFASILASAEAAVSADSLGLHIALALKTPVIGLFCSTVASEIEWFGIGEPLTASKGPCYKPRCVHWPGCVEEIRPEAVLERIEARRIMTA